MNPTIVIGVIAYLLFVSSSCVKQIPERTNKHILILAIYIYITFVSEDEILIVIFKS